MINAFVLLCVLIFSAQAYVPTVESLFRHGSNPDVTANGLSVTMAIKKVQLTDKTSGSTTDVSLLKDERQEDFYKLFFTKSNNDILKIAQTRYKNSSFSESSLEHKIYFPNFTAYTIKPTMEETEKGLFFATLHSLVLNDGLHMVDYLKSLGVPAKPNKDLINREKIDLMASYKRYLVTLNRDRNAKKTEVNPLRPDDLTAREKVERIMNESMYVDIKQVKLAKDNGNVAWMVSAGNFEAVFSYRNRDLQRIKYRSPGGDFEIICKDYWLANGSHALPRFLVVRSFTGQTYQVEITNLRHYVEKEDDLVKRLRNWDQVLRGKESTDPRPEFML